MFRRRPKPEPREHVVPAISVLAPFVDEDPQDFAALDVSCGKFIDAWLAAGGEPHDEAIIGFYSLWAQGLDARGKDEADYFGWAHPLFLRERGAVRASLEARPKSGQGIDDHDA